MYWSGAQTLFCENAIAGRISSSPTLFLPLLSSHPQACRLGVFPAAIFLRSPLCCYQLQLSGLLSTQSPGLGVAEALCMLTRHQLGLDPAPEPRPRDPPRPGF